MGTESLPDTSENFRIWIGCLPDNISLSVAGP